MTHKALLRQLQISCLGLDAVDPLRLLVDDVVAALAQPELCKYGQEPKSCTSSPMDCQCAIDAALAQQEQDHIPDARKMVTEQEPVVGITAIRTWFKDGRVVTQTLCNSWVDTTPPHRTWVGLTDREKSNLWLESRAAIPRFHTYATLVEAKLKEKNT